MKKILAIIPARGGSKGIIDKNIIDVNGMPLLQYTVDSLLKLVEKKYVHEAILSTDSQRIASIGKSLGINVPFLRPFEISNDKSKSIDFVLHALEFYRKQNRYFDSVLILQPTSPLRTYNDIKESIIAFDLSESDSLISCYKEDYINSLTTYKKEGDYAVPINPNHNKAVRRQDHSVSYVRNGAIYLTKVDYLIKNNAIISDKPLMFEMPKHKSINIDTEEDLIIIKKML
jgi:CMP-N,N'-diacetyllegionaminic acid synthase